MNNNNKHFPADTSLEYKTFLNDTKVNGELYAYLQAISYGDEKIKETVVYKKTLPTYEEMGKMFSVSKRTITNRMKYLKDQGYIVDDLENKRYILPKLEKMYFTIPQDTLVYLREVVREPVIKTYIYLGQRNNYKPGQYVFTVKEICEHLGFNYKVNYSTIKNYLIALHKFELIDYVEFYEGKTPKIRLLWVNTKCPKK